MATVLEQLQARLIQVDADLDEEKELKRAIGQYKQHGDKQDRTVNQDLGSVYARIKTLEAERTSLQNQINRLSGARRAASVSVRRC